MGALQYFDLGRDNEQRQKSVWVLRPSGAFGSRRRPVRTNGLSRAAARAAYGVGIIRSHTSPRLRGRPSAAVRVEGRAHGQRSGVHGFVDVAPVWGLCESLVPRRAFRCHKGSFSGPYNQMEPARPTVVCDHGAVARGSFGTLDRKQMSKFARNHHVGPQGYLTAFTDEGTRDGRLGVFDFETRRFFTAKPRNVGVERDFNRVHVQGRDPDSLEKALGDLEGTAISVIRRICTEGCVTPDDDFNWVLNLIYLLVVRNPTTRRSLVRSRQHEGRIIAGMLASDRRLYEHHVRETRRAGDISGPDVPFERMRSVLGDVNYKMALNENL